MPFTASHPAIVLPLKRYFPRYFSLSGLMAGAMSPDLLYFLAADTTYRGLSHSWSGLFLFCLPAGLIFTLVFHWFVKRPLILNSPRPIASRLGGLAVSRFQPSTGRDWVVLISSVFIGALSHFFWDAGTHASGEIVQLFPMLAHPIELLGIDRPIYRLLQHFSSFLGLIFIPWYLLKSGLVRPATQPIPRPSTYTKLMYWAAGLLSGLAAAAMALHLYENNVSDMATFGLAGWAGFFWWSCLYSAAGVRFRLPLLIPHRARSEDGASVHHDR